MCLLCSRLRLCLRLLLNFLPHLPSSFITCPPTKFSSSPRFSTPHRPPRPASSTSVSSFSSSPSFRQSPPAYSSFTSEERQQAERKAGETSGRRGPGLPGPLRHDTSALHPPGSFFHPWPAPPRNVARSTASCLKSSMPHVAPDVDEPGRLGVSRANRNMLNTGCPRILDSTRPEKEKDSDERAEEEGEEYAGKGWRRHLWRGNSKGKRGRRES